MCECTRIRANEFQRLNLPNPDTGILLSPDLRTLYPEKTVQEAEEFKAKHTGDSGIAFLRIFGSSITKPDDILPAFSSITSRFAKHCHY
jgi:hypothetical protein